MEKGIEIKMKKSVYIWCRCVLVMFVGVILLNAFTACGAVENAYLDDVERDAVNTVEQAIDDIGEVSFDKRDEIEIAEEMYSRLSVKCKEYVENYDVLQAKRKAFDDLVIATNSEKAKEVSDAIDELGKIGINSETLLLEIQNKYDCLTDEQKLLVENYDRLGTAFEEYEEAVIENVIQQINGLKKIKGVALGDAIERVEKAYEALNDEQKQQINNRKKIKKSKERYSRFQAKQCENQINKLYEKDIAKVGKADIFELKKQYDSLTKKQKELVKNVNLIEDIEKKYDDYQKKRIEEEKRKKDQEMGLERGEKTSNSKWEITVVGYSITNRVNPIDTSGYYWYKTAGDDVFLDIILDVKNIWTSSQAVFDAIDQTGKVEYKGQTYNKGCSLLHPEKYDVEDINSWDSLGALNSARIHVVYKMPSEVKNDSGRLCVKMNILGKERWFIFRS